MKDTYSKYIKREIPIRKVCENAYSMAYRITVT